MSEIIELYRRAVDEFDRRVSEIGDDQWDDPTPCTDWNVRELVNHIAAEDLWVRPLVDGMTLEEVGDRFDGDVLGDDPRSTWAAAREAALAAADGATDRLVHTSMGQITVGEYLGQLFADHLVHAWDLARAIGADENLDPELVGYCYRQSLPYEEIMKASGVFGDRLQPAPSAGPQQRLLALYGRRA